MTEAQFVFLIALICSITQGFYMAFLKLTVGSAAWWLRFVASSFAIAFDLGLAWYAMWLWEHWH